MIIIVARSPNSIPNSLLEWVEKQNDNAQYIIRTNNNRSTISHRLLEASLQSDNIRVIGVGQHGKEVRQTVKFCKNIIARGTSISSGQVSSDYAPTSIKGTLSQIYNRLQMQSLDRKIQFLSRFNNYMQNSDLQNRIDLKTSAVSGALKISKQITQNWRIKTNIPKAATPKKLARLMLPYDQIRASIADQMVRHFNECEVFDSNSVSCGLSESCTYLNQAGNRVTSMVCSLGYETSFAQVQSMVLKKKDRICKDVLQSIQHRTKDMNLPQLLVYFGIQPKI